MRRDRIIQTSAVLGWLLLVATLPIDNASAAIVSMYTSQSAFNAASGGSSTDNFSSYSTGYHGSSLATTNGATIATNGDIFIQGPNAYGTGNFLSAQQAPSNQNTAMLATVPGDSAVGTQYFSQTAGTWYVNTTSGTQSFNTSAGTSGSLGFIGFTSGSQINSVEYVTSPLSGIDMDNFAVGHASAGSTFGVSLSGLPSDITLSNATLLVANALSDGSTTYQTIPMGAIAESGGSSTPPPVLVPIDEGLGAVIESQSVNVLAEYTNSDTLAQGVALLVGDGGGLSVPPPVLEQSFNSVFNAASEGTILQELQNVNSGGSSAPNLDNFMQNNSSFMFPVTANSSISDGEFYSYSTGTQIGTLDATVVVTPEPSSLLLLAIGSLALWFAARRRRLCPH
jgi:hypothetical protein